MLTTPVKNRQRCDNNMELVQNEMIKEQRGRQVMGAGCFLTDRWREGRETRVLKATA